MSGYKRVNFYELCRLCATSQHKEKTHIFQEEGRQKQLQTKIQSLLSLKVCENDYLPKVVCSKCLQSLEICYTFRNESINSESMLSSYFNNFRYTEDFTKSGQVYNACYATRYLVNKDEIFAVYIKDIQPKNEIKFLDEVTITNNNEVIKSHEMVAAPPNFSPTKQLKSVLKNDTICLGSKEATNLSPIIDVDSIIQIKKLKSPVLMQQKRFKEKPIITENDNKANNQNKFIQIKPQLPIKTESKLSIQQNLIITTESNNSMRNITIPQVYSESNKPKLIDNYQDYFPQNIDISQPSVVYKSENQVNALNTISPNWVEAITLAQPTNCKDKIRIEALKKNYECKMCNKTFKRREHLYQHSKLHTGFRPFTCENCNKSFMRKEHLLRHMTTHSGLKHFRCDLCGKSFSRNDNLLKHKKTHDKEEKYTCEVCQKQFVMKHYYKAHTHTHEVKPEETLIC